MTLKSPDELKSQIGLASLLYERRSQLPPVTKLHVDEVVLGVRYAGTFTYKVPTIADTIMIGQLKNQYLPNGGQADPASAALVEQVCYLSVTLQDPKPSWWSPLDFMSGDIVHKLYSEAVAYANTFLGRAKDAGAAGGGDAVEDAGGSAAADAGDVESDLPGANERSKVVISHASRAK